MCFIKNKLRVNTRNEKSQRDFNIIRKIAKVFCRPDFPRNYYRIAIIVTRESPRSCAKIFSAGSFRSAKSDLRAADENIIVYTLRALPFRPLFILSVPLDAFAIKLRGIINASYIFTLI